MKSLTRKGFLIEEQGMGYLAETDPDLALGPLRRAACTYRIALGPRAGQKVLSLQTVPPHEPPPAPVRGANEQASASMPKWAAPPIRGKTRRAAPLHHPPRHRQRASCTQPEVVLTLKTPYRDGTALPST